MDVGLKHFSNLIVLCFVISSSAICQITTWLGGIDNDWNNSLNWSDGVPGALSQTRVGTTYHSPTFWPVLSENVEVASTIFDKAEFNFNGYELKVVTGVFRGTNSSFVTHPDSIIKLTLRNTAYFNFDTTTIFHNDVRIIKSSDSATGYSQNRIEAKLDEFNVPKYVIFKGDLEILLEDASLLSISGGIIDGDLKVTRTYEGNTILFNTLGGKVRGDFTFNYSSPVYLNASTQQLIGRIRTISNTTHHIVQTLGKLTINIENTSVFNMHQVKNNNTGSSIYVNAGRSFFSNDTLSLNEIILRVDAGSAAFYYNYFSANKFQFEKSLNANIYSEFRQNIFHTPIFLKSMGGLIRDASHPSSANHYYGDVTIEGNVILGYADTSFFYKNLTINPSASTVLNGARFVGNANSKIQSNTSTPLAFGRVVMNKTEGASLTLEVPISIQQQLSLIGGVIHGSISNFVQFEQGSIWSGGSNLSHVKGLVKKRGNQSFVFPLGKGNSFNPVSIGAPSMLTDVFSASYHHAPPSSVGDVSLKEPTLSSISDCEYWQINREVGSSAVPVTLYYGPPCDYPFDQYITDPSRIKITKWSGTQWQDLGNGGYSGNSITTAGAISEFSPFTFASSDPLILIPVNLISFSGISVNKTAALKWITTQEVNVNRYVLERSMDGLNFQALQNIPARNINGIQTYTYTDRTPQIGSNYYRLRIEDYDGSYQYSEIVPIMFTHQNELYVYPNPAKDNLTIWGLYENQEVRIVDASGRILKVQTLGNNQNTIDVSFLTKGLYFLQLHNKGGIKTIKFIKE